MKMGFRHFTIILALFFNLSSIAQSEGIYDENEVPEYKLPDLFTLKDGQVIQDIEKWEYKRRNEILDLFKDEMYGTLPTTKLDPGNVKILEHSDSALDNKALRKQIALEFSNQGKEFTINILIYLPKGIKNPPVFIGYNFYGNQSTIEDPKVVLTDSWVRNNQNIGITNNQTTEESRGKRNNRWPIEKIISEGFGLVTVYYGDVDPDKNDFSDGIHPLFYKAGQEKPYSNEWGSISAWAWGLSRVLDHLKEVHPLVRSKFILFGHSRLGKTSLWAGALDNRFDIVISNNSGCGGAAISRRKYGETVAIINNNFPHWFSNNFKKYNDNEESLPVDQHMLIALIAPRPVYIASAEEDRWADPRGEYLSCHYATPVYELYGKEGLKDPEFPKVNTPIHNTIGYHVRTGKHDVTDYDWIQFMKFAKKHINTDKASH